MAEHGHRPGLPGEPLGKGRVLADLRREDLQRHQPVKPLLPGLVDHAHAAPADQLQDLQVGKWDANSAGVGGTNWASKELAETDSDPAWERRRSVACPNRPGARNLDRDPGGHPPALRPRTADNDTIPPCQASPPM